MLIALLNANVSTESYLPAFHCFDCGRLGKIAEDLDWKWELHQRFYEGI